MISGGAATPAYIVATCCSAPTNIRPGGRISSTGCTLAAASCAVAAPVEPLAVPGPAGTEVFLVVLRPMIGASTSGAVAHDGPVQWTYWIAGSAVNSHSGRRLGRRNLGSFSECVP
ncbi:hypothetical protein ABIA38_004274 [Embleya sp. AB8]